MNTCSQSHGGRHGERGVTMVLVAIAMVAIIAMAALAIDLVTLYLAREEAQRSADTAALGAARVLSLSGVTGDPQNTTGYWPAACTAATQVAQALANQNAVSNAVVTSVNVNFLYNGTPMANCAFSGENAFGVNPQVQVKVVRGGLPTFFSRIWSRSTNSVSATATAEAFNSSGSGTFAPNGIVPVNPRCVKPWIIPNQDPRNGNKPFVGLTDGSIQTPGIRLSDAPPGVIGETLLLTDACTKNDCDKVKGGKPSAGSYVGALVASGAAVGVPTCADDSPYQEAIGGCDQNTAYACGFQNGAQADLSINPKDDTYAATQCLIHQSGPDFIDTSLFPYQIHAGPSNPVVTSGIITSSTSIVSIPIYDQTQGILSGNSPQVTIVGFLQAFINVANSDGSLSLTVLNVAGCSNAATTNPVSGTSPVPVRLITPQ